MGRNTYNIRDHYYRMLYFKRLSLNDAYPFQVPTFYDIISIYFRLERIKLLL